MAPTVRQRCLAILAEGDLTEKLAPLRSEDGSPLPDSEREPAVCFVHPARAAGLELVPGSAPLPRPGALRQPAARAACLARFAHHELMAVELFAWALLCWPEMPSELRRGLVGTLEEEQRHCRLYLSRLAAHGSSLAAHRLSDYFWRHVPAIQAAARPVDAFLAAMGLTLEQANLDFTLLYRDAFGEAGDEASANVCQQVHDDEVRHVRLAAEWLDRLGEPGEDAWERYQARVPFPLGPARAKGRRFDVASRRRAGLSDEFIEGVRTARSSQELRRPRTSSTAPGSPGRTR